MYHSPRKAASPNTTSQDGDVDMPTGSADPDPEPPEDKSEKIVPWQEHREYMGVFSSKNYYIQGIFPDSEHVIQGQPEPFYWEGE